MRRLLPVIHCDFAQAPRRRLAGWPRPKHATLLNICNGSACKTNDSSRFRLALSHLPNPQKCKHADILSHVIVELGSEISFATLKKIKIPFSLKSKIGVFQPQ